MQSSECGSKLSHIYFCDLRYYNALTSYEVYLQYKLHACAVIVIKQCGSNTPSNEVL